MDGISDGTDMIVTYCQGQGSSTLQAVFLPHRLKSPIFCEKKILIRFPARFSLPSMPLGTTLRVPSEWHIVYFYEEGWTTPFYHSLQGVPYARSIFPFASSDEGDESVCRRHHR